MRDEFIVECRGETMVMYAGLLDEAHDQGLRRIKTDLIKLTGWEGKVQGKDFRGLRAITKATVSIPDPKTGESLEFDGIGDADPANVEPEMAAATIRVSETRAKARALKDALNEAEMCLEELGPASPESSQSQETPRQTRKTSTPARSNTNVEQMRGAAPRKARKMQAGTKHELISLAGALYGDHVDPVATILDKVEEATGKRPRRLEQLNEPVAQKIKTSLQRRLGDEQAAADATVEDDLNEEELEIIEEMSR